jgi:hypothetical protein
MTWMTSAKASHHRERRQVKSMDSICYHLETQKQYSEVPSPHLVVETAGQNKFTVAHGKGLHISQVSAYYTDIWYSFVSYEHTKQKKSVRRPAGSAVDQHARDADGEHP